MKYIKPETILIELELSNLVMGSPKEHVEFDDSDDSFNDSWD